MKIEIISLVFSGLALLLSLSATYLAAQSYRAAYRPYVGVVGAKHVIHVPGPPKKIAWEWRLKNVGTVPARITRSNQKTTVTIGAKRFASPGVPHEKSRILLPEQELHLPGSIEDKPELKPQVHEILSGKIPVEVIVELEYESPDALWGLRSYTYRSTFELTVTPALGFKLVDGDAN